MSEGDNFRDGFYEMEQNTDLMKNSNKDKLEVPLKNNLDELGKGIFYFYIFSFILF